jgi:RHS repeat-associated protein
VFGYTGREFDSETGLYYYRARYYSPRLGQFLQTDPIGTQDDVNLYRYVGSDPLNQRDPTGLCKGDFADSTAEGGYFADECPTWTGELDIFGQSNQQRDADYENTQETIQRIGDVLNGNVSLDQEGNGGGGTAVDGIQVAAAGGNSTQPACMRARNICLANTLQSRRQSSPPPANDNNKGLFFSCNTAYAACLSIESATKTGILAGGTVIYPDGTSVKILPRGPSVVTRSPRF